MALWTLTQIADAVYNNVTTALHGSPNSPIPKEQLRAECILLRNTMHEQMVMEKGAECAKAPGYSFYQQQINCLEVKSGDPSDCCEGGDGETMPMVRIPEILITGSTPHISYIGTVKRSPLNFPWRVYYGESFRINQFLPGSGKLPYGILYPARNGYHNLYIYNAPPGLTTLSITGVFMNPYSVYEYSCCGLSGEGEAEDVATFAAPEFVVNAIIEQMSQRYIGYYRQMNVPIQQNDQTDKST